MNAAAETLNAIRQYTSQENFEVPPEAPFHRVENYE
jgi:hypothetical protein